MGCFAHVPVKSCFCAARIAGKALVVSAWSEALEFESHESGRPRFHFYRSATVVESEEGAGGGAKTIGGDNLASCDAQQFRLGHGKQHPGVGC